MNNAIEIENLSKRYTISEREKYLTLRDMVVKAAKVPGNLLQGKKFRQKDEFWALKDINFTVKQGEVVGIIGRNGAGKSTLLKVLSRITEPTHGIIKLNGRVSSLLEVGTGFHPELTGRENIYLNGAIMGMSRKEIDNKIEEIITFSGVEKFIDMPVKRYSSGMQVRLAFSVAAHLEPDILIIDEVLAVGDAEFQKKCLGKMDEVTKKAGRTILFVSHDMGAIQRICNRVILLDHGEVVMIGDTEKVIKEYMSYGKSFLKTEVGDINERPGNKKWIFKSIGVFNSNNKEENSFNEKENIVLRGVVYNQNSQENALISVVINRDDGVLVSKSFSKIIEGRSLSFETMIKNNNLFSGIYDFSFWIGSLDGKETYDFIEQGLRIEIINKDQRISGINYADGIVLFDTSWNYEFRK